MSRGTRIQTAWRFTKGISKAFQRGEWLPDLVRDAAPGAPGGSTETLPSGSVLQRLGKELDWFTHSSHVVPLEGLERPLRLLHLTDVHIRRKNRRLMTLCDRVSEFQCDGVMLTGDVVAKGWEEEAVSLFLEALPDAPLGRFAVMGNWEHWGGAPAEVWEPLLARHDVRLLRDESLDLGPLHLAGTEDLLSATPDVEKALAGLPKDRQSIVLTHSPGLFPQIARREVGLVLSGHSHGGQFRLPGVGALFVPRATGAYVAGWYEQDGTHLFVNRGIGWSIAPLRLWCPPELAEIQLVPMGW